MPLTGDLERDLTSLGVGLYRLLAQVNGIDGDTELQDLDVETLMARGEARANAALASMQRDEGNA